MPLKKMAKFDMLPTPNVRDWKDNVGNGRDAPSIGLTRGYSLGQKINSMLPTPNAVTWETSGMSKEAWEKRIQDNRQEDLNMELYKITGTHSQQLNPQFVLEMMGFPTDWTLLPFLNGETNQLKQEVTP
jgi:hypothetical protein